MWPFNKKKSDRTESTTKSSNSNLEEITLLLSGSLQGRVPTPYDYQRINIFFNNHNARLLSRSPPFNSEPQTSVYLYQRVAIVAQPGKYLNLIGNKDAVYDLAQKLVDNLGMSEKDATIYTKPLLKEK